MIQNFPINASDVTKSHTMFGPNLSGARFKTVQHITNMVVMVYVAVPRIFLIA